MDDSRNGRHAHQQRERTARTATSGIRQRRRTGAQRVARRYQTLLEMAPDATVVVDREGRIRLVNRQTEVLFGHAREELLGQPVETLIPERFHAAHEHHRAGYAAAPRTRPMGANLPLFGRHKDGSEFPVAVSLAPLEDEGETFVIASIRDATDLQRARAANEELRRLQALTDTALAHLDLDALLAELLPRVRDVLRADHVTILLLADDGQMLVVRGELHVTDDAPARPHVPVGVGFAGHVASSRAPLIVDDLATFPLVRPQLHQVLRSAAGVPLLAGEHLLGVLCIGTAQARHFSPQEVALLEQAAARITTAIEHARLFSAELLARQEIERERIRWLTAMNSAPEFVITCDVALRRTYVNPAYERLRGGPADPSVPLEELSSRYGLFLPDGKTLFPVEQLPLHRAVHEGQPVRGVEMLLRGSDGQERLIAWESAPMYTLEGELLGAISIGHDISERRQMEQEREAARVEAERQAEQLDRIIEAMADGVTVWNAAGQLVRTNAALRRMMALDVAPPDYYERTSDERMAFYAPRDAQDRPLPPEDLPVTRALRGEVLTGAEAVDLHMRTFDGRDLVFTASAAPLRDQDGHIIGAVGVLRDQTERKQLEHAVAEQAAELQTIFDALTDPIFVYDASRRLVRANPAARQLLPADQSDTTVPLAERDSQYQVRGADGQLLPREAWPMAHLLRGEVLASDAARDVLVRLPDGRDALLSYTGGPIRDAQGQLTAVVAIARDETRRRELERALAEQAEQLERIVEGIGEGLFVYDADGQVVRTNAAARQLLGLDTEEDAADFFARSAEERLAIYAPRGRDGRPLTAAEWPVTRTRYGGAALTAPETWDLSIHTVDGREVDVSATWAPLRTPDGERLGIVLLLSDRTERNRLVREREAALVTSESWFRMLADTAPVLVWVSSPDGPLTFVNRPWLQFTGRTLEDELGGGWAALVHPDDFERCMQTSGKAMRAREPFTIEYRLRRADGEYRWLLDSGVPRYAADGTFAGYIGSCIDISERRELERLRASELALREVNERLDTFVTIAVHDLRAPVGISRMVVQHAQQQIVRATAEVNHDSEAQARAVSRAVQGLDTTARNLDRLWRLVQQLLDVRRIKEETLVLNRELVNLVEFVRTCVEEQRLLTPSRIFELCLLDAPEPEAAPLTVSADPDRLSQVLTNYVTNAVRYAQDDHPIAVTVQVLEQATAADSERAVRVSVRDHGPGIAPEEQASIWGRFQRARTTSEAKGGLGLGLYIARTIVELHGGQVGVDSVVGEGSTFWFTLPLSPALG